MPENLCLGTFETTLARSGIFADMDNIQAVPTLPGAFFAPLIGPRTLVMACCGCCDAGLPIRLVNHRVACEYASYNPPHPCILNLLVQRTAHDVARYSDIEKCTENNNALMAKQ